jgi:hypothetical protein
VRVTCASLDKSLALLVEKIMSNVTQNSIAHDFVIIISEKAYFFSTIPETLFETFVGNPKKVGQDGDHERSGILIADVNYRSV